jgi:hypothetical protein
MAIKKTPTRSDRAIEYAEKLGLRLPSRPPEETSELPDDLTDLSSAGLTEEMAKRTAWLNYARSRLSVDEIALAEARDRERKASAIAFTTLRASRRRERVGVLERELYSDESLQLLRDKIARLDSRRIVFQTIVDSYENQIRVLSRELTRRVSEIDRDLD